jgi:ribose 5-phosphate isomerase A
LKKVSKLGSFPLPLEVVQYGCESTKTQVMRYLAKNGYKSPKVIFRGSNEKRFVSDEGNFILDLHLNSISNEETLANDLNLIPGVLENGLFINICNCVVLADENELVTMNWKDGDDRNS